MQTTQTTTDKPYTEIGKKLRAKKIAELYPVGQSTIWAYAKKGLLTPIRVTPGVTVFDISEVEALFNGKSA